MHWKACSQSCWTSPASTAAASTSTPRRCACASCFTRLRLHFEPVAFEKGLALRFHGAQRVLHSDPLLVERIVRNLLSNAIRYSEDGGVLVACRPKPGQAGRLLLQVWDSGVGIDTAHLPHVFDEFYQVQRDAPLAAGQKKGAWVSGWRSSSGWPTCWMRRLTVRSQPGRGTVFTLELPAGREPRTIGTPAAGVPALPGPTLVGRRILVVEGRTGGARRAAGAARLLGRRGPGIWPTWPRCRPGARSRSAMRPSW